MKFLLLIIMSLLPLPAFAALDNSMSVEAIAHRLEPVGKVNIEMEQQLKIAPPKVSAVSPLTGKNIYQKICSDCHATGEVRSPRFGDSKAWSARTAKGLNTLYEHALEGFKFMPPKGTCDRCSDDEIKAAVRYMVEQSKHQ